MKYVDVKDIATTTAQKTGVYVGPGNDHRFYKAGDPVARTYVFSREIDTRGYRAPIKTELKATAVTK